MKVLLVATFLVVVSGTSGFIRVVSQDKGGTVSTTTPSSTNRSSSITENPWEEKLVYGGNEISNNQRVNDRFLESHKNRTLAKKLQSANESAAKEDGAGSRNKRQHDFEVTRLNDEEHALHNVQKAILSVEKVINNVEEAIKGLKKSEDEMEHRESAPPSEPAINKLMQPFMPINVRDVPVIRVETTTVKITSNNKLLQPFMPSPRDKLHTNKNRILEHKFEETAAASTKKSFKTGVDYVKKAPLPTSIQDKLPLSKTRIARQGLAPNNYFSNPYDQQGRIVNSNPVYTNNFPGTQNNPSYGGFQPMTNVGNQLANYASPNTPFVTGNNYQNQPNYNTPNNQPYNSNPFSSNGFSFPQQSYPQQSYPQQNFPQQQNYPQQQSYPQQSYPQQSYPQQSYPQQSYPQQNYPQQQSYPQPSFPQQNYPQQQQQPYYPPPQPQQPQYQPQPQPPPVFQPQQPVYQPPPQQSYPNFQQPQPQPQFQPIQQQPFYPPTNTIHNRLPVTINNNIVPHRIPVSIHLPSYDNEPFDSKPHVYSNPRPERVPTRLAVNINGPAPPFTVRTTHTAPAPTPILNAIAQKIRGDQRIPNNAYTSNTYNAQRVDRLAPSNRPDVAVNFNRRSS